MKSFISYARLDVAMKEKFRRHLKPLEEPFGLHIFDDQAILPGEDWEKTIWAEFEASEIIFVLISVNFINSEFCLHKEFKNAVKRHKAGKVTIVPIILKSCDWQSIESLKSIQVLPDKGKPISGGGFKNHDLGFTSVMTEIKKLLFAMSQRKSSRRRRHPSKPLLESYNATKYKAVFFDLDGTLIRGGIWHEYFRYSWQLVWSHLGLDDTDRKRHYQDYVDGKTTYQEWCDITRDLFRAKGLRESDFREMAKKVRLTKNCRETLSILKRKGILLVLVSGGIDCFLRYAFPDHMDYFDYVFLNKFHFDDDGVLDSIETTKFDFDGKYDAIQYIRKKHKFELEECVFIGEGRNDIFAARELNKNGGLTIGYPSEHLRDYATYDLWKDRLDAILDLMFDKTVINMKLPIAPNVKFKE